MSSPTPPRLRMISGQQHWLPAVAIAPYVLLALLALFTVVIKRSAPGAELIDLILCAVAAAWMLWMITLHPGWRDRPPVMAVFFTVFVVIMAVLVIRDPWFGFLTPAGYIYAFTLLPWPWRVPGAAAIAVLAGTAQASPIPRTTSLNLMSWVAIIALNVSIVCGAAWMGRNNEQRDEERERVLAELSEANLRLEATLAENAGLHEQLMTQAREAGVFDERQRMAREIHDTLAQGLAGIVTQLQAAEQAAEDPAGWRRHFDAATRLARESLSEARRSVHALRPEPLETARLSEALTDVAGRWSALHGVAAQVTTTGTVRPMAPEAELALLRAAQEALANVARHAHASRVGLTVSYLENEVALDVRDDGKGFDPPLRERGEGCGFGLIAMRQRIESLSGTLQVESEPGGGTAISACVPAEPAEPAEPAQARA
jgi:signal transduction histidine kinase